MNPPPPNLVSSIATQHLAVDEMLQSMAKQILIKQDQKKYLLVAIQTGGVWVGEIIHQSLGLKEPMGTLDISFYRDDFSRLGLHPVVRGSDLPVEINNRNIILVDDVLHTGRTARAALNELFAWGRPSSVILAVLLDRGNRELPLHADVVGQHMHLGNDQFIKISPSGRVIHSNFS